MANVRDIQRSNTTAIKEFHFLKKRSVAVVEGVLVLINPVKWANRLISFRKVNSVLYFILRSILKLQ